MAFPSPAKDYEEHRLTPESLCGISANSAIMETSAGVAVVEQGLPARQGATLLIRCDGRMQFAVRAGSALVCDDGDTVEGEALDGVEVLGVVTWLVNKVSRGNGSPAGDEIDQMIANS